MTGLEMESLCARLDRFGPGRPLDDNATVLVNFKGGARGVFWSSQIAAGHDNACACASTAPRAPSNGSRRRPTRPASRSSTGLRARSPAAAIRCRPGPVALAPPSGHPEGYFESFANIYATYLAALAKKLRGEPLAPADLDFPNVDDGVRGVRYIESCIESSARGSVWVEMGT